MYSRNTTDNQPMPLASVHTLCKAFVVSSVLAFSWSAQAEDVQLPKGYSLWSIQDGQVTNHQGPALLRPTLGTDAASLPNMNFASGIGRQFDNGLSLDAGVSISQAMQLNPVNYRDYFMGVSYGNWDGKVWYLPEAVDSDIADSLYYEAGWSKPVGEQFAFSLRVGQQQSLGTRLLDDASKTPNLSLGASANLRGYGLGLRLVESGGQLFGGEEDLRVMGSISKPFP